METVAACSVFFVPFLWNSVAVACRRHCLVPCRIHDCNVRNVRKNFLRCFNTHDVCRHVERSETDYRTESVENFRSNFYRFCEFVSAMEYAVTNSTDNAHVRNNAVIFVSNGFKNELDCFFVSRARAFLYKFVLSFWFVSNN